MRMYNATDCGFDPHSRKCNKNYFQFFCILVARHSCGVEYHHSTSNTSRIRRNVGNGRILMARECFNTKFPLPTLLFAGYSVKLKRKKNKFSYKVVYLHGPLNVKQWLVKSDSFCGVIQSESRGNTLY